VADDLLLKVTQVSTNQTTRDYPRNLTNIFEGIRKGVELGSDLVVFDEMSLVGYDSGDDFGYVDNDRSREDFQLIADYAEALDPDLIVSVGGAWRFWDRDSVEPEIDDQTGANADIIKSPLYNRLGLPFNVQAVMSGGKMHGMTAKANLFNDERGYEKRYFSEWSMSEANKIDGIFGTLEVPFDDENNMYFGRPVFSVTNKQGKRFNFAQAICEEKWVATKFDGSPYDDSRYDDLNIIPATTRFVGSTRGLVMNVSNASPPARDKIDRHHHLNALASKYSNLVIDTDGLGSSGSAFAQFGHRQLAQDGKILKSGKRLSFDGIATSTSTVRIQNADSDTQHHGVIERNFQSHNELDALHPNEGTIYELDTDWDRPDNQDRHKEEVIRMTALWLMDYMAKTKCQGIAEALSGGADSCFNTAMVAIMVRLAVHELGVEGFLKRMPHLKYKNAVLEAMQNEGEEAAIEICLENMLTGVYMPTNNSDLGKTGYASEMLMQGGIDKDTGEEIKGIGGKFFVTNVQDLLDFYAVMYAIEDTTKLAPDVMDSARRDIAEFLNTRPGTFSDEELAQKAADLKSKYPAIRDLVSTARAEDGIAYENIQARGRQVLIMLIANKEGKMAIANPNLDEARNAYATYGGDLHSGTINLNAHLNKDYQLELMQYLYDSGLKGVMEPIKALGPVLKNKPSAELQPKNEQGEVVQHDEDALKGTFKQLDTAADYMLYSKIDTTYGPRRLNASEVFDQCHNDKLFTNVSDETLYDVIVYRYARWGTSQHKIHASPIAPTYGWNVDHQVSMRTPNFSGNSRDELVRLGIDLMFKWAKEENCGWDENKRAALYIRARTEDAFVNDFMSALWNSDENAPDYDLRRLYSRIHTEGWQKTFGVMDTSSPQYLIHQARLKKSAPPPSP